VIAFARWLLRSLLPPDARDAVCGDLDGEYRRAILPSRSRTAAAAWYWRQVLGSMLPALAMRARRLARIARDAAQDARIGLRLLARDKTYTAAAVVTLALGIGANSAVFSVVDAVLLRPLPYRDASTLVRVWSANPRGIPRNDISPADYFDLAEGARGLDALAAMTGTGPTLTGAGDPVQLDGAAVTANLAGTLGVGPRLGRWFLPEDTAGEGRPVAVLSERLWRERFGADAGIVGRTILLDATPREVIGVMAGDFALPSSDTRVWTPMPDGWRRQPRGAHFLAGIGRLSRGVSIDAARDSLRGVARALEQAYPDSNRGWGVTVESLHPALVGDVRAPLLVLASVVALILLIACANVASLTLARGAARSRELAVRAAVGATASRLLRQQLVESALLAALGGALALLVASWSTQLLRATLAASVPLADRLALDGRVLAVSAGVSLAAALLTGLLPAWQAARQSGHALLKDGGRTTGGGIRARQTLVIVQIAAATALVAGGFVLVRSLARLTAVPSGFLADRTVLADVSLPPARYTKDTRSPFFDRALDRIRALPGVQSAGAGGPLPLSGQNGLLRFGVEAEGRAPSPDGARAYVRWATPGYFSAMGIPQVEGRAFGAIDTPDSAPVCVIDEALARRLFAGESPIGRRVKMAIQRTLWRTIVGVVGSVRQTSLDRDADPHVYLPEAQFAASGLTLVVRSADGTGATAAAVRDVVVGLDRDLPLSNVRSLADLVAGSTASQRFSTTLLAGFAGVALLLTLVGVYGVIAQSVAQSTRELAVRLALGASGTDVVVLTLRRAALMTMAGVLGGAVVAWLGTPALRGMLYGIGPHDPIALGAAAGLLVLTALAAAWIPARRILRLDVVHALRDV
jgi:putative ABC transport system permease protein